MFTLSFRALILLVIVALVYVITSSAGLPPRVASHFTLGGAADAFMSRSTYTISYVALLILMPLLLPGMFRLLRYLPPSLINLPNRDYWLAPKRIEATFDYLSQEGRMFGLMQLIFFCFVHYLVLQANRLQPPRLAERPLLVGATVFLLGTLIWAIRLIVHFRNTPSEQANL